MQFASEINYFEGTTASNESNSQLDPSFSKWLLLYQRLQLYSMFLGPKRMVKSGTTELWRSDLPIGSFVSKIVLPYMDVVLLAQ